MAAATAAITVPVGCCPETWLSARLKLQGCMRHVRCQCAGATARNPPDWKLHTIPSHPVPSCPSTAQVPFLLALLATLVAVGASRRPLPSSRSPASAPSPSLPPSVVSPAAPRPGEGAQEYGSTGGPRERGQRRWRARLSTTQRRSTRLGSSRRLYCQPSPSPPSSCCSLAHIRRCVLVEGSARGDLVPSRHLPVS